MRDLKKGAFCKSIAGHDKGSIYIVIDVGRTIKVCDGRIRKLSNAKSKNPKHLVVLEYEDFNLTKSIENSNLRDEEIKYSLKKYLNHIKKIQEENKCQNQML